MIRTQRNYTNKVGGRVGAKVIKTQAYRLRKCLQNITFGGILRSGKMV